MLAERIWVIQYISSKCSLCILIKHLNYCCKMWKIWMTSTGKEWLKLLNILCLTVWAVALNSLKVPLYISLSLMSCCNIFHLRAAVWIWARHSLKISRLPKSQSSHCVLKYLTASCTIRLIGVALIPQIKMFSLFCAILRSVTNAWVCKCNEGGKFSNWCKAL